MVQTRRAFVVILAYSVNGAACPSSWNARTLRQWLHTHLPSAESAAFGRRLEEAAEMTGVDGETFAELVSDAPSNLAEVGVQSPESQLALATRWEALMQASCPAERSALWMPPVGWERSEPGDRGLLRFQRQWTEACWAVIIDGNSVRTDSPASPCPRLTAARRTSHGPLCALTWPCPRTGRWAHAAFHGLLCQRLQ